MNEERLRNALKDIRAAHLPDQPASSSADEVTWVMQHVGRIRKIAADALEASPAPSTVGVLRLCGFCSTWHSRPCGEGCHWQITDPLFQEDACRVICDLIEKEPTNAG